MFSFVLHAVLVSVFLLHTLLPLFTFATVIARDSSTLETISPANETIDPNNFGLSFILPNVLYARNVQDIGLRNKAGDGEEEKPLLLWRQHELIKSAIEENLNPSMDKEKDKQMFSFFGNDGVTVVLTRPIFADIDASKYGMAYIVKNGITNFAKLPNGYSDFFFDYDDDFKPAGRKYINSYPVVLKRYQKEYSHWAVQIGNKEVHVIGQTLARYIDYSRSQEGIISIGPKFSTVKDSQCKRKKKQIEWQLDEVAFTYISWARKRRQACVKPITDTSIDEIWQAINDAALRYFERRFDAFEHNCYKFASDVIEKLCGGKRVKSKINSLILPQVVKLRKKIYQDDPQSPLEEPLTLLRHEAMERLREGTI